MSAEDEGCGGETPFPRGGSPRARNTGGVEGPGETGMKSIRPFFSWGWRQVGGPGKSWGLNGGWRERERGGIKSWGW